MKKTRTLYVQPRCEEFWLDNEPILAEVSAGISKGDPTHGGEDDLTRRQNSWEKESHNDNLWE